VPPKHLRAARRYVHKDYLFTIWIPRWWPQVSRIFLVILSGSRHRSVLSFMQSWDYIWLIWNKMKLFS
jgi:hypothetical protein